MRKLIMLLFIIISTPFLQNSRQEENMNEYKFYMTATIVDIDEKKNTITFLNLETDTL